MKIELVKEFADATGFRTWAEASRTVTAFDVEAPAEMTRVDIHLVGTQWFVRFDDERSRALGYLKSTWGTWL